MSTVPSADEEGRGPAGTARGRTMQQGADEDRDRAGTSTIGRSPPRAVWGRQGEEAEAAAGEQHRAADPAPVTPPAVCALAARARACGRAGPSSSSFRQRALRGFSPRLRGCARSTSERRTSRRPCCGASPRARTRPALVVTRPDRPRGRGRRLAAPPVADAARELGIDVDQPDDVNSAEARARIAAAEPGGGLLCAFGALLREPLLSRPRDVQRAPVAAPALARRRAGRAGDPGRRRADRRVDHAPGRGARRRPGLPRRGGADPPDDDYGTLAPRLAALAGELLVEALDERPEPRAAGRGGRDLRGEDRPRGAAPRPLPPGRGAGAHRPGAHPAHRRVRGAGRTASAWACARRAPSVRGARRPGELRAATAGCCSAPPDGALELLEVQPPGGRPMPAADYLRGRARSRRRDQPVAEDEVKLGPSARLRRAVAARHEPARPLPLRLLPAALRAALASAPTAACTPRSPACPTPRTSPATAAAARCCARSDAQPDAGGDLDRDAAEHGVARHGLDHRVVGQHVAVHARVRRRHPHPHARARRGPSRGARSPRPSSPRRSPPPAPRSSRRASAAARGAVGQARAARRRRGARGRCSGPCPSPAARGCASRSCSSAAGGGRRAPCAVRRRPSASRSRGTSATMLRRRQLDLPRGRAQDLRDARLQRPEVHAVRALLEPREREPVGVLAEGVAVGADAQQEVEDRAPARGGPRAPPGSRPRRGRRCASAGRPARGSPAWRSPSSRSSGSVVGPWPVTIPVSRASVPHSSGTSFGRGSAGE